MKTDTIFSGYEDKDGQSWKLSLDDVRRVIVGRGELHKQALRSMQPQIERCASGDCIDEKSCREGLGFSDFEIDDLSECTDVLSDPGWIEELAVCRGCRISFLEDYNDCRDTVWSRLARIFQLQDVKWPVS